MTLELEAASARDAAAIVALRNAVAERLTLEHGRGHWSSLVSERGVLHELRTSRVFVAREKNRVVATLSLGTRKPWAIDRSSFTDCRRPLYLCNMAVQPGLERRGIGRWCLEQAKRIALSWPSDAIRLDAYDADAGAGAFYARCGFREVGRTTYRNTPLVYYELLLGPGAAGPPTSPERQPRPQRRPPSKPAGRR